MKINTIKKLMIILTIILIALFSFEKVNYASVPQEDTLGPSASGDSDEDGRLNYSADKIIQEIELNYGGFGNQYVAGGSSTSSSTQAALVMNDKSQLEKLPDEVLAAWENTLSSAADPSNASNANYAKYAAAYAGVVSVRTGKDFYGQSEAEKASEDDHPIYKQPQRNDNNTASASTSLDDMMNDADDFVSSSGNVQYDQSALQDFSSSIYNILLTVGVAVAVIVGAILGVKLMLSSVEEKADTKKMLVAYAVGCLIVFGGFGIWKLVIIILEGI